MSPSFLFFASILVGLTAASDRFWLTTVVTEFRIRDECAIFWHQSQACPAPLLRVLTDVNSPTQFASRAWPIESLIAPTEKPSFVSQWHGSLRSVRVSAQIEGSSALNPFGLVAKCDQGAHPKIAFNQSSVDVFERLSTRVVVVTSQCFTAKVLLRVDTECPYCPTTTTSTLPSTTASALLGPDQTVLLIGCSAMLLLCVVCCVTFCFALHRFVSSRRGFKQCPSLESGISTITTSSVAISNITTSSAAIEAPRDFFAVLPPIIDDYVDLNLDDSIKSEQMPPLGSSFCYTTTESLSVSVSDQVFV